MPWDRLEEPAIAERLALYRELIGLRRAHPVLASGGLRCLHVDDHGVVFVRESADETLLVLASRGDMDASLPAPAVIGAEGATALVGEATLSVAADGSVLLSADGPAFAVWSLPGVVVA